jgi:molecular chaperone HscB
MISLTDSFFQLFDLPDAFEIDLSDLQARFLRLQGQVHPDRFSDRSDAEKRLAMQWATHVNEAHSTLKDPVKRAAYWCQLHSHAVNAEYNTAMSPGFLMQQMEWRESLADARSLPDIETLAGEVAQCRQQTLARLAQAIDVEVNGAKASELTRQMMFIEKFRQELNTAFDRFDN